MLYLIEFLHQTTTDEPVIPLLLQLYLIEFLHQTTTGEPRRLSAARLYLIEFLHQTTTKNRRDTPPCSCILLNFYIKPQPLDRRLDRVGRCILLNFYIKPQRRDGYRLILRILQPFDDSRNLLSVRRRSRFDVFFRISKNKYSQIFQKNSNCWGISGLARSLFPQKFRISPYCLSVTARMLVYPDGGIERLTRLM